MPPRTERPPREGRSHCSTTPATATGARIARRGPRSVWTGSGRRPRRRRTGRLSADIAPGAVTVLTGPNGAGKSTALQVILGLIAPPRAGSSSVASTSPNSTCAQWWAQVAWLPQRPVLIPGTVRENLDLFGALPRRRQPPVAQPVSTKCWRLCPTVWTPCIGRGGTGLSLGQRQRLGLARVLGSSAPVLLLDEPTSHLDAAHRRPSAARRSSTRARAGATVVLVGHRGAVLAIGDNVVQSEGAALAHR